MKTKRTTIAALRREEIVGAAVAVIAEQGLQNLSLSEIESKVGMSRGQLTYYFRTKEDILLAVFDRLLQLMYRQQGLGEPSAKPGPASWLELFQVILEYILRDPPACPEFNALQFTFLSQISHRNDFRRRLAQLYEEWRISMATVIARDLDKRPAARPVSPRALATFVQAILHGIAVQKAADPESVNADEIAKLCLDLLGSYLGPATPSRRRPTRSRKSRAVPQGRIGARASANGVHP